MLGASIKDACIVIPSCDAYADVWSAAVGQLTRMWPDCRLRKYLLVNDSEPGLPGVTPLAVGRDEGWSANLRSALRRLPHAHVFLLIDDLFLTHSVDNAAVEGAMLSAMSAGATYVRFLPYAQMGTSPDELVAVPRDTPYRVSTVMSFWRTECLFDLLDPSENAWQFEIGGTERAIRMDGFFATKRRHFSFYNLIVKGQYRRRAVRLLRHHGYALDPSRRSVMSRREDLLETLRDARSFAFKRVPRRYQNALRNAVWAPDRFARTK